MDSADQARTGDQKGIRFRATEALNEKDYEKARVLARKVLDDPEVEKVNAGVRASLERLLVLILGDRPTEPVERVMISLPQRDRVEPKEDLPPPQRSLIRSSPVLGGCGWRAVNGLARNGIRGK